MPPCASSKRPSCRATAPVKAPFSWPNSSLSASDSVSAAQLSATKGPAARRDLRWMRAATSSLPVPDLAEQQHGRVGRRCAVGEREHRELIRIAGQELLVGRRRPGRAPLEQSGDEPAQRGRALERFRQVVGGAETHRLDGVRDRPERGHHHHGGRRRRRAQPPRELEPVEPGQALVDERDGHPLARGERERLLGVRRFEQAMSVGPQDVDDQLAEVAVVVDDQDRRAHATPSARSSRRTASEPPPARERSASSPPLARASARAIGRPSPVPSARPVA